MVVVPRLQSGGTCVCGGAPQYPGGPCAHLQRVGGMGARLAALAVALSVSRQQSPRQVYGCPPVFCGLVRKTWVRNISVMILLWVFEDNNIVLNSDSNTGYKDFTRSVLSCRTTLWKQNNLFQLNFQSPELQCSPSHSFPSVYIHCFFFSRLLFPISCIFFLHPSEPWDLCPAQHLRVPLPLTCLSGSLYSRGAFKSSLGREMKLKTTGREMGESSCSRWDRT